MAKKYIVSEEKDGNFDNRSTVLQTGLRPELQEIGR